MPPWKQNHIDFNEELYENCDDSKLSLAIFERTYDDLYIGHFLFDRRYNFTIPHLKRVLKIPN